MSTIQLNNKIAFLRKQNGVTQEELAGIFGVTNQSVSKWESGQCCPDISLLPDIATYFNVSLDELMSYKPIDTKNDIYMYTWDYSACSEPEGTTLRRENNLPIDVKENENHQTCYRIQGSYMHIPTLLLLLRKSY